MPRSLNVADVNMRKSLLILMCFSAVGLVGFQALNPSASAYTLEVTVDITPSTLNVNMEGKWITARLGLPKDYNVRDIDTSTILLEGLFRAEWSNVEGKALMVKFDAHAITDYLWGKLYHMGLERTSIELKVTGQLKDGTYFEGSDTITIMNPFGF